jgi:hypothetical protein
LPFRVPPRAAGAAAFGALLLAIGAPAAAGDAFLLAGTRGAPALRRAIEGQGGLVRRILPGGAVVAEVDDALAARLLAAGLASRVERGPFDAASVPAPARLAAAAFSLGAACAPAPPASGRAAAEEGGDALPRASAAPADGASGAPDARPTTIYLAGDVGVAVVFLASDGSRDPSTEAWTDADRAAAFADIQAGLDWLAREADATENGRVVWTYDVAEAATPFEAVTEQAAQGLTGPDAAVLGGVASLGFSATPDGASAYAVAVRARLGTDQLALLFVAPTANDEARGGPGIRGYAYLGGPYCVMGHPGYYGRSLSLTAPHEVSHLFNAADEYGTVFSPSETLGWLNVANENYQGPNGNGADNEPCTMRDLTPADCPFTLGQVGLLRPGAAPDGTPDAMQWDEGGLVERDQISVRRVLVFDDGRAGSSGNADFQPGPGERVALAIDLVNETYVTLHGAAATLAVASGPAQVAKADASFGDVPPRATRRNAQDLFLLDLDPSAAPGASVALSLEVHSDEGWTLRAPASLAIGQDPRGGEAFALEVDAPVGAPVTSAAALEVAGRTNDPRLTSVTIAGAPASLAAGAFRGAASLVTGTGSIVVDALVGATGDAASATIAFTRKTAPPGVAIDTPADGASVPGPSATVAGTIDDPAIATVRVAGLAVAVSGGRFAASVPVAAGPNALEALAVDAAGNQGSATVHVTAAEGASQSGGGHGGGCQAGPAGDARGDGLIVAFALGCIAAARLLDDWTRPRRGGRLP